MSTSVPCLNRIGPSSCTAVARKRSDRCGNCPVRRSSQPRSTQVSAKNMSQAQATTAHAPKPAATLYLPPANIDKAQYNCPTKTSTKPSGIVAAVAVSGTPAVNRFMPIPVAPMPRQTFTSVTIFPTARVRLFREILTGSMGRLSSGIRGVQVEVQTLRNCEESDRVP